MLKVVTEGVQDLEAAVDADLAAFEKWFQGHLQNGEPLVSSERAILKTYLYFKTRVEPELSKPADG